MKRTEAALAAASLWTTIVICGPAAAATLDLGINTGLRKDSFDWNIAGNLAGSDPDILSELAWKDLEIFQIGLDGRLQTHQNRRFGFYLRGHVDYGWILDGQGRDSDYDGDNRTGEFSRSTFTTRDDDVLDASIGAGLQWRIRRQRLAVAMLGGYSYHEQNLRMTEGVQVIDVHSSELGPFPEWQRLNSTYDADWWGPWVGIDFEAHPHRRFAILATLEYHFLVSYRARADWNLRPDFAHPVSFRHETNDADGIVMTVTGQYRPAPRWVLDLTLGYQEWKATDGIDRTYFASGSTGATRLNEANWESVSATAGISYFF